MEVWLNLIITLISDGNTLYFFPQTATLNLIVQNLYNEQTAPHESMTSSDTEVLPNSLQPSHHSRY